MMIGDTIYAEKDGNPYLATVIGYKICGKEKTITVEFVEGPFDGDSFTFTDE